MSFQECISLIKSKFGNDIKISDPYKLCDYKQVYGIIFDKWVKDFDYWGFCDCDLIFGDIRKYVTDKLLDSYEHLFIYGHFQIKKNTPEVNDYYKLKHLDKTNKRSLEWENVIKKEECIGFDEFNGLPMILMENKKKIYRDLKSMADINTPAKKYKRMMDLYIRHNFIFQYWVWDSKEGRLYNVSTLSGKRQERLYIHLQKRRPPKIGFEKGKDLCILPIEKITTDKKYINLRNTFVGIDLLRFFFKKIKPYIEWHIKNKNKEVKSFN